MATSTLNMENFESTVTADGITLVDFWAEWCGPCRQFGPIFEQTSEEHPDAVFAKVDTEAEQELAGMLGIMSIPTLMIFRDGIQLFSQPGALPKSALDDLLRQVRELDMDEVRNELADADGCRRLTTSRPATLPSPGVAGRKNPRSSSPRAIGVRGGWLRPPASFMSRPRASPSAVTIGFPRDSGNPLLPDESLVELKSSGGQTEGHIVSTNTSPQRIAVIGTGYVGLTTGASLAHFGFDVACCDIDERKVSMLKQGIIPIVEDGLSEMVADGQASGRLTFHLGSIESVAAADVVFLCVPTPQDDDGSADLTYVKLAATEIGPHLRPGAVVVNKSTVPVGSFHLVGEALARADVDVVSNPEFLREGSAVHDCLHPDRVVIGAENPGRRREGRRPLRVTRHPDHPDRPRLGGDDQVRRQRVPRDEDLVHQQRGRDV